MCENTRCPSNERTWDRFVGPDFVPVARLYLVHVVRDMGPVGSYIAQQADLFIGMLGADHARDHHVINFLVVCSVLRL
jgi:hypothetical protein